MTGFKVTIDLGDDKGMGFEFTTPLASLTNAEALDIGAAVANYLRGARDAFAPSLSLAEGLVEAQRIKLAESEARLKEES